MKSLFVSLILISGILLPCSPLAHAQEGVFQDEYLMGEIISTKDIQDSEIIGDDGQTQDARIEILDGSEEGNQFDITHQFSAANQDSQSLKEGEKVIVVRNQEFDESYFFVADKYRLPSLIMLLLGFFLLTIALTGFKGFTALIGLGFNILVITGFIIPNIINGYNPLLISFIGGIFILFVSLYFAHGFNKRTTIALVSTLITLVIALALSLLFVWFTKLSGTGTEEAYFLQFGSFGNINLKGLLLGGIMIGALGVLDDVTTAQTAAIHELKRANHSLNARELYRRGLNIGSEHITSLVNTLALAYAGSAMPVLLLFTIGTQPLWVTLNSELIAEELVRTLVGSIALILAVPITTALAAHWYSKHAPLANSKENSVPFHHH